MRPPVRVWGDLVGERGARSAQPSLCHHQADELVRLSEKVLRPPAHLNQSIHFYRSPLPMQLDSQDFTFPTDARGH